MLFLWFSMQMQFLQSGMLELNGIFGKDPKLATYNHLLWGMIFLMILSQTISLFLAMRHQ
ncbi:uncharacterized protein METZ01_LOCUS7321 [marine metagenome]|uniref:Uncharacterized protein n=1 Tax=marine metagenome TaxID=408172 RepID=A0A381NIY8_9ZZZZ